MGCDISFLFPFCPFPPVAGARSRGQKPEPKTIARAAKIEINGAAQMWGTTSSLFFVGQVQRLPAQEQLMETRAAVAADPCTRSRYLPGLLLVSHAVLRVRTLIAVPYNAGSIRILIAVPDNTGSIRTLIAVRTKLVPSILIWPSVLRLQWWKRFNICKRLSYS